jgi:hypothetical protein
MSSDNVLETTRDAFRKVGQSWLSTEEEMAERQVNPLAIDQIGQAETQFEQRYGDRPARGP